ncbi:unnamed protein product, partial [Cyprideis torosa]
MKLIKKFKSKIGLIRSPPTTSPLPCLNAPPLHFHAVHGDNIRLSADKTIAKRVESFCKGVTFSHRPVKVNERVYIRFTELSTSWSGVIRFGFTSNDPVNFRGALPKYACPDLTSKDGFWAKALSEQLVQEGAVLFFYFTNSGDINFGFGSEEKGVFCSGLDTRGGQLWAMIDVYGNSTAVQFLDFRDNLNNSSSSCRRALDYSHTDPIMAEWITPLSPPPALPPPPAAVPSPPRRPISTAFLPVPVPPAVASTTSFHLFRGNNIALSHDRKIAWREAKELPNGYVFSGVPLRPGYKLILQVGTQQKLVSLNSILSSATEPAVLAVDHGLTLPQRKPYWRTLGPSDYCSDGLLGLIDNLALLMTQKRSLQGDELSFSLQRNGAVEVSRTGPGARLPSQALLLFHVDETLTLWPWLDIRGHVTKIKLCGITPLVSCSFSPVRPPFAACSPSLQMSTSTSLYDMQTCTPQTETTDLRVSLPRRSATPPPSLYNSVPSPRTTTLPRQTSQTASPNRVASTVYSECTICYEAAVDTVLYTCGHLCMCYPCATEQWGSSGVCPICRAVIRDVIRTFRA